jgi:hypothetical protein
VGEVGYRFVREEWPQTLRLEFAEASARAAHQIAASLGARRIRGTRKLTRPRIDVESPTTPVDHPHVRTIAIEPDEFVDALTEACVVVTGDTYVVFES